MRWQDRKVAEMASVRHGVVTRGALLEAGISPAAIDRRIGSGGLIPVHRGVYRVGHRAPSREATYLAAVLACGPDALLCRRPAAHLHVLIRGAAPPAEVVTRSERRIEGILTCRSKRMDPQDATVVLGDPSDHGGAHFG
jgi:hypothetical protein